MIGMQDKDIIWNTARGTTCIDSNDQQISGSLTMEKVYHFVVSRKLLPEEACSKQ